MKTYTQDELNQITQAQVDAMTDEEYAHLRSESKRIKTEALSKFADKPDFNELTTNGDLKIAGECDSYFYVECPYVFKNAFKKKFKAKWSAQDKSWKVSKSSFYKFEILDYVYTKNKKIVKGTAKAETKKRVSTSSYSTQEAFEDYCHDNQLDYKMGTSREKEARTEFNTAYNI